LNKIVFLGCNDMNKSCCTSTKNAVDTDINEVVSLPSGNYLFVQYRGSLLLKQDEWLDMAIEQQKDGLWERHKPGNLLFVRYLHEDGEYVTQLFRTVAG